MAGVGLGRGVGQFEPILHTRAPCAARLRALNWGHGGDMRIRILVPALIAAAVACSSSDKSTGPAPYTLTLDGIPTTATEGDTIIAHVRIFTPTGFGTGLPVTFIIGEGAITQVS